MRNRDVKEEEKKAIAFGGALLVPQRTYMHRVVMNRRGAGRRQKCARKGRGKGGRRGKGEGRNYFFHKVAVGSSSNNSSKLHKSTERREEESE